MALRQRFVGLLLIAVGVASMGVIYWFYQHGRAMLPQPPVPSGLPRGMTPMISPLDCVVPIAALGATALTIEGFRRLIVPDESGPDR